MASIQPGVSLLLLACAAGSPAAALFAAEHKDGSAGCCCDHLADYFDRSRILVLNRARAGRSSRTFQTEGLWESVLADLKAGDFVLIQFGHNDAGLLDTGRARGSLETVHTYGWYMRRFIAGARAKGATPMVLSLTVRNIWKDGQVERGSGRFGEWAAAVAKLLSPKGAALAADAPRVPNGPAAKSVAAPPQPPPPLPGYPMPEPANPTLSSLFLIGDSTVRNGHGDGSNGQWGWGRIPWEPISPSWARA